MIRYKYKPVRFYTIVFILTWLFWVPAIFLNEKLTLMFLGLLMPAFTGIFTVLLSKNKALISDFKRKIFRFYDIKPFNIVLAIVTFFIIVMVSIVLDIILFNGTIEQLSFSDFSFSIDSAPAILVILLASIIEEVGWRSYGEDAIAFYHSWFKESIIFGMIWSLWHLPLFFIEGSYHHHLIVIGKAEGVSYLFALNFLISVIPLGFLTTWVYVKNNRSMLSCILFHLAVNLMQEKIAMTNETKCVETVVLIVAAVIIVWNNKELFFEKDHIGNML